MGDLIYNGSIPFSQIAASSSQQMSNNDFINYMREK